MNTTRTPEDRRMAELARRNGMENSLYLGEAIGETLAIAWNAFGSLAGIFRRGGATHRPAQTP